MSGLKHAVLVLPFLLIATLAHAAQKPTTTDLNDAIKKLVASDTAAWPQAEVVLKAGGATSLPYLALARSKEKDAHAVERIRRLQQFLWTQFPASALVVRFTPPQASVNFLNGQQPIPIAVTVTNITTEPQEVYRPAGGARDAHWKVELRTSTDVEVPASGTGGAGEKVTLKPGEMLDVSKDFRLTVGSYRGLILGSFAMRVLYAPGEKAREDEYSLATGSAGVFFNQITATIVAPKTGTTVVPRGSGRH